MVDPLDPLVADGIIEEVLTRLKSGKEADIYLVQHAGEILAAKVYKERHVRSFKNNAEYKEGRAVRNTRTQRAMQRGSRFGRDADEEAWKAKESEALGKLFAEGVRVPKPHLFYEGVLLMETVVDAEGHPAPRLIDADIPRERAAEMYNDLRQQIVTMLTCDLIHGDLSPYNVLFAWNGPTIIDFPQVVGAAHNSKAEFFFARDLETIRKFFATIDPSLHSRSGDVKEIWKAYVRRELTADFVPSGRVEARAPAREGSHGPRREFVPERREAREPRQPREPRAGGGAGSNGSRRGGRPDNRGPKGVAGTGGQNHKPPRRDSAAPAVPAVSYVGRAPPEKTSAETGPKTPGEATGAPRRRRRRRRGGGGGSRPPPGGGGPNAT